MADADTDSYVDTEEFLDFDEDDLDLEFKEE